MDYKKQELEQILTLLEQDDPFYGIYMVYDMYGPSSNKENPKNQTEIENE